MRIKLEDSWKPILEEQFLETDPRRANYTHLQAACRSLARCRTRNDWVYQAETYLSEERKQLWASKLHKAGL